MERVLPSSLNFSISHLFAVFESTVVTDTSRHFKEQTLVPFLPVNPELSTMRNQGRQKLARLNCSEFATLVWDILIDCKRRHNPGLYFYK